MKVLVLSAFNLHILFIFTREGSNTWILYHDIIVFAWNARENKTWFIIIYLF